LYSRVDLVIGHRQPPRIPVTYQGSKDRFASRIVPILARFREPGQVYWEPFMGSGSIMQHMDGPRLGTDSMTDLMMLWQEVIDGTFVEPTFVCKEIYDNYMSSGVPSAMRAYLGFFWSFSGMFNKGFSPEFFERSHSFHKMRLRATKLNGVTLRSADYRDIGSRNFLIYADPPYQDSTTYNGVEPFDHGAFYDWCRAKRDAGNRVIISEYSMPEDFVLLAEFQSNVNQSVSKRDKYKPEKLFTL
jgi:site-specific DNA-adenine methylase